MQVSSKMEKRSYKSGQSAGGTIVTKSHMSTTMEDAQHMQTSHNPSKSQRHVQIRQSQHHRGTPSPTHSVITTKTPGYNISLESAVGCGGSVCVVGGVGNNKNRNSNAAVAEHTISASGVVAARNKNEEAITDLRQRIPEIENIFDVHGRIGNGTFSTVLLGTLKKERGIPEAMRRKFAIKHHIPTSHPDRIMKELQCMARMGGTDNVIGINCCIRYNESVAFIMPYLQHDRFHDFFSKMELSELQHYMRNLLIALRHVHKFNIIHRDVKPSNFLYNRQKRQFLLVDFGLAQQVPTPQLQQLQQQQQLLQNGNNNLTMQHSSRVIIADGKRARDDEAIRTSEMANAANIGEATSDALQLASNGAKRFRGTGPQGDQQQQQSNTFKMPLKQLNEIANSGGGGNSSALAIGSKKDMGAATNQLPFGLGNGNEQLLSNNNNNNSNINNNKYNTSRNVNTAKCYCYGQPQVCNVCLVKKEIHASRAGTPGYRPPEVLLKYPDQTTSVDIWAAGVILLSILSSVYPFFKAPNDYVALAEIVTIFGDKIIRKTGFLLDRLVTLSQKTRPLDLRKLCVRFRNRIKFSSHDLLLKYQDANGSCEVCKNCDQYYFNCLCAETSYETEPLDDVDPFPKSVYDLLYRLLEVNPHKRITADEALRHPFFSENLCLESVSEKQNDETIVPVRKK